jgi:hypothetical protein
MDYLKKFMVVPCSKLRLAKIDPSDTGEHESHKKAIPEIDKQVARMDRLQYLLYADASQSLLIVFRRPTPPERTESSDTCSPA